MKQILIVYVQDEPGVLNRVSSMIRKRNYNIDSLVAGETENAGITRMTIVLNEPDKSKQSVIVNNLKRLIDVYDVVDATDIDCHLREYALLKIAIINNGYLGMVRQWQQMFYDARYNETPISSPDYLKIAEAYGLPGFRVKERNEIQEAVKNATEIKGPALIEFVVEQHDMVYPMVPAGADLHEMISRPVHDQFQDSEM